MGESQMVEQSGSSTPPTQDADDNVQGAHDDDLDDDHDDDGVAASSRSSRMVEAEESVDTEEPQELPRLWKGASRTKTGGGGGCGAGAGGGIGMGMAGAFRSYEMARTQIRPTRLEREISIIQPRGGVAPPVHCLPLPAHHNWFETSQSLLETIDRLQHDNARLRRLLCSYRLQQQHPPPS